MYVEPFNSCSVIEVADVCDATTKSRAMLGSLNGRPGCKVVKFVPIPVTTPLDATATVPSVILAALKPRVLTTPPATSSGIAFQISHVFVPLPVST